MFDEREPTDPMAYEEEIVRRLSTDFDATLGIVRRPVNQLRALSANQRWELTRRHPYYLRYWKTVQPASVSDGEATNDESHLQTLAMVFLGAIGVGIETVDPQCEFDQLATAGPEATAWLYGSAHPLTCRAIVGLLIAALPPTTLARIGRLLSEITSEEENVSRSQALFQLAKLCDPALQTYPDEPFLSVSPAASVRELQRDLPVALKPWRDRPRVVPHRDRSDQVQKYLEIWDRREGWAAGRYVNANERSLRQIATELRLPISTVSNRYRSAFQLITGHPYSPVTWLLIFGPDKLSTLFDDDVGPIARHRPLVSPTRRPVPDRSVSPPDPERSLVEFRSRIDDENSLTQLRLDIETLLAKRMTFAEICREWELAESNANVLQSLYERLCEAASEKKA